MRTVDTLAKRSTRTSAEKALFVAQDAAGVVDEPFARTIDEPEVTVLGIHSDRVDAVVVATRTTRSSRPATISAEPGETVGAGDQRASRGTRLDVAWRNDGNRLAVERDDANRRRQAHGVARGDRQPRLPADVVERTMTSPG